MSNTTFLDTYLALRASSEAERKQRERERQTLLNTMALAEAELAKPEYFGFLIERDRMGYLEALSQTKTTFRGINPHDPFDGIVLNGGINPDFVMMLEKNFFKNNSENIDKDELYFVRYENKKDLFIVRLKETLQELFLDDDWVKQNIGISKEEIFEKLNKNELILCSRLEDGNLCMASPERYCRGVENGEFQCWIPNRFLTMQNQSDVLYSLKKVVEAKKLRDRELNENKEYDTKLNLIAILVFLIICLCFVTYTIFEKFK